MPRRLTPPLRGAANNTALVDTPESFCPPDNLRNVRPYGSGSQERPRMGPRPGLIKAFANQLGSGNRIQAMTVVGRASGVSGYEPGEVSEVDGGVNRTATTLAGCCWALDAQHGMFADFGTGYAYGVSWHPTLKRLAYFIITTDAGGKTVTRVRYCDADTTSATFGTNLWSTDLEDQDPGGPEGTFPIYGNHIVVDDTFTYICAGPWLYVLRTSDGVFLQRYDIMGWSEECMGACIRHDGKLCVAFRGTTTLSGPVTTNIADTGNGDGEGAHFRSGVMLFAVDETQTDVDDDMLTETQFGTKRTATAVTITGAAWTASTKRLVKTGAFTSYTHATGCLIKITGGTGITAGSYLIASKISNDEIELVSSIGPNAADVTASELQPIWYEDHLYWRTSEHVAMQPRGRYCNSIAALPDGGIVVATCNKGWGPNSTYAPDSTIATRTVIKINSSGVLVWEADFASRLDAYPGSWGTYYNDIPHPSNAVNVPGSPHPSADAIAVDPNGDIYVAGRETAAGFAVHKIRGTDGAVLWETDTGDWVAQNAIAYDAVAGVLVVAGKRNTSWEGAGGANAHLWFIDPANGEILNSYDLAEANVNAWGVAISADGDTAFATDKVT